MSSKRSDEEYIKYLQKIIENANVKHSKKYNIESVALLLNIPIVSDYNEQCALIIEDLNKKKRRNKFITDLLKITKDKEDVCYILIQSLYSLFYPTKFPKKSPIKISEKEYLRLIQQQQQNKISKKNKNILKEAMNVKYCHCLKKIYLKNQFEKYINNSKKSNISAYPLCMTSVYKSRNIKPPFKVSHSCRERYEWYN
jgi:hypothetical protein